MLMHLLEGHRGFKDLAIPNYYLVYLKEHEFDINDKSDPVIYEKAMSNLHSNF